MEFKTYREGNLYCYLSVVPSSLVPTTPGISAGEGGRSVLGTSSDRLSRYLRWAAGLAEGKTFWAIIRETPESTRQLEQFQPERIAWKYDVVANDTEGLGVDKGFIPTDTPYTPLRYDQSPASLLCQLDDLSLLLNLPENALGDKDAHVSLISLQQNGQGLLEALRQHKTPQLHQILDEEDLFLDIKVGKEQQFYDSFLVKAGRDIDDVFTEER
ncbi:hypothetical protein CLV24_1191 [Pontibacter ummariensis]|uniref:Uncharacterized protein n=1 Tax=Pontibacter ummariensis TaxID=1610492 RepID=A0A239ITK6_9BACT|nr:hypothetical protein [Pontibacter ummariensis]PRY08951.1 hypothetical protein CLV24_1191 [Pontibacter ummariensis]SNS96899.1 hypothetical protein SAMN06296052_1191 [Pontibacter ummariensis]